MYETDNKTIENITFNQIKKVTKKLSIEANRDLGIEWV